MNSPSKAIAAPGSDLYYSLLYCTESQRQAIIGLFEFAQAITSIRYECSDLQIAQQKLSWWESEITRAYQNNASHPIAKKLAEMVTRFALPQQLFIELIEHELAHLENVIYTFDEYLEQLRSAPDIIRIISRHILNAHNDLNDFAAQISIVLKMTAHLLNVRNAATKGIIDLPLQELEKYSINQEDIINLRYSDGLAKLLRDHIDYCQQRFTQALRLLPVNSYRLQLPLLIYAKIKLALLNEIKTSRNDFFKYRIELTPLQKLWIAWKMKWCLRN